MNQAESQKYLRMVGQELQAQNITGEILLVDEVRIIVDVLKPRIQGDIQAFLTGDEDALEIPVSISDYFDGEGTATQTAIGNTGFVKDYQNIG